MYVSSRKKCRKWKMGQIDFSPQIMIWKNRRDTWNMIVQFKKGQKRNSITIRRKAKACGIFQPLSATLQQAQRGYAICRDEFNKLKPYAALYRREFLSKRIIEEEESGNKKQAQEIRQIMRHEETRRMWGSIARARCKRNGRSIAVVEVNINGKREKLINNRR